jgi:hypothetical protein
MLVASQTAPQMPIRLPSAESIRRQIADTAASLGGEPSDRYLAMLGSVEPTWPPTASETPWRLTSYLAAYEDGLAIERAVGVVQRRNPFMRVG